MNTSFSHLKAAICLGIFLGTILPAQAQPNAQGNSPSAQEVVDRFIKSIGGREAFLKLESQHAKGRFEMPEQGISGPLEVFSAKPDNLLVKITLGPIGEISTGFNGEVAWLMNAATGPMLLEGKQREQIKEQADFYAVLRDPENYTSMENLGKTQFEGKETYELKLVKKSGQELTEYFDVETGLLAGFKARQETELGPMLVTNLVNEYKQFGDVRVPTKMIQKIGPIEQVMTINSVEFNKVDPKVFELPPEIKALTRE
jgi:hypothetical protein